MALCNNMNHHPEEKTDKHTNMSTYKKAGGEVLCKEHANDGLLRLLHSTDCEM